MGRESGHRWAHIPAAGFGATDPRPSKLVSAHPQLLLGFEADGDANHKGLLDRMRDEARDQQAGLIGWTIKRYSTEDIRERPAGIAEEVRRLRSGAEAA